MSDPFSFLRRLRSTAAAVLLACVLLATERAGAAEGASANCGDEGVWIQILGAGSGELRDGQHAPSYLVWQDNVARLLVDAGPGASTQFAASGASVLDLDAIAFTQLSSKTTADLPAILQGALDLERNRALPVLGPDGNDARPGLGEFLERFLGGEGVYPEFAARFGPGGDATFRLRPQVVPATGQRRWARFGNEHFRLSAIPVNHGDVPALAWLVTMGDFRIAFTGDFNNAKNAVGSFARGADALVVSHAIHESARGALRSLYATPSQLGQVAANAEARILILGSRTSRTRGRESQSREAIEQHYEGSLIFANDMECWGL